MSEPTLVCVTGASGYIGSHVIRELLARGHRVRGTVRDAGDERKVAHLEKIAEGRADRLELFSADLLDEGAYDEAIAGCEHVYHIASAVYLTAKDPQREIVEPAVRGTENVFASIARAGSVKRVGLTSSIAAIASTDRRPDHTFTEDDWVEDATLATNPYGLSKREAEKAAWAAREAAPEGERYELVVVNPVLVIGPAYTRVHLRSSVSVIRDLMRGTFKGAPNLGFGIVDVRDVARALVDAVEAGGKTGRHILFHRWMMMREIAEVIAEAFPDRKVPTRKLPGLVLYVAALFDRRLSWAYLRRNLGRADKIDSSKAVRELGVEWTDAKKSVVDTCESFIEHGLV
jgi:dihydroflavonol-4-reductase